MSSDEDRQRLREAQIAKYIALLYEDVFEDWRRSHSDQLMNVARHAVALSRFRHEKMTVGATSLDTFVDFRDWRNSKPDEAEAFLQASAEGEVIKFLKEPTTAREVRNLAFASFTPDAQPTHRMLQELMSLDASGPERDQIVELGTRLLPWCREGNYGALFDGATTVSLTGKIAHFELGYIPEAANALRALAGFLITNYTRQHIVTLPRSLRKRNIFEEVSRFMDIPGGEQIVKESYAQLRKFNCWNISIVQQYARFKESRIRAAVFGNSRQVFLMRQNDRSDLDDIATDIALPEVTKEAIMRYPLPDHQGQEKYASFTYLHTDAQQPICGTVHAVTSDEVLECSRFMNPYVGH